MGVMTFILVGVSLVGQPKELLDIFEAREYHYNEQSQKEFFRYYLFVPPSLKPTERYPLLVWLHWGNRHDIFSQEQYKLLINEPDHLEKYRFFILAIPCPEEDLHWRRSVGAADLREADSTLTLNILQKTMRRYPVDPDRVYLSGICRGAPRCLEMAMRYPKLFSAIVLLSYSGGDVSHVAKLVNIPIWAFHSRYETYNPFVRSEKMVAAVKGAGGNIHLTLVPSDQHDCWTAAFRGYCAMDWMLAQRRGVSCWWLPPGCIPWKWWHILTLPCAFLVFLRLGWLIEQRRRRRRSLRAANPLESGINEADFCIGPLLPGCEPVESKVEGVENCQGTGTTAG